ncbi:MAG: 4-phosphoerythronate dehydrogenase [Proteobacteria bacterium]|nr:4-phosphoerythronate dehydrogenase [Pseudomonadota bacterium]
MQSSLKNISTESLSIVADQQILFAKEAYSGFGEVQLVDGRSIDYQSVQNADILLVRSVTKVNESLLKDSNVKFVGSATSGIDHIDIDYLEKANITFAQALGSNARSVAEYVLSSLFVAAEQKGFSLTEKTVGIIGCGQVGSRVKRFLQALGVNCLLNDPPLASKTSDQNYVELDDILQADIITLHVPLTAEGNYPTSNLLDKEFLARLKSDVIIINSSRGGVIDEKALLDFKQANPAATLILDVWLNEPQIDINLLKQTFIATPHIAGYSYDGKLKATQMLFDSLNNYLGQNLDKVNLSNSEQEILYINDDVIQFAVLQSYDVRTDGIALMGLMNMEDEKRGQYFDSLRNNYPVRREFSNRTIQTHELDDVSQQQLQQLGFKVETI